MKPSKVLAGLAAVALLASIFLFPPLTPSGDVADLTLAYATADEPSGIYYDRDFDWPTGEAVWVDIPAFALHLSLLALTLLATGHHYAHRVPPFIQD